MDDFELQLRMAFRDEAKEHIHKLTTNLIKLETCDGKSVPLLIEDCFRSLHNLKGSAHAVQYFNIEALCHPMEDIIFACKSGSVSVTAELLDAILEGVALVERILEENDQSGIVVATEETQYKLVGVLGDVHKQQGNGAAQSAGAVSGTVSDGREVGAKIADHARREGASGNGQEDATSSRDLQAETLKVAADKLDLLMRNAEEMLSIKVLARQLALKNGELSNRMEHYMRNWSKSTEEIGEARLFLERMGEAARTPQEEMILRRLGSILDSHGELVSSIGSDIRELSKMAGDQLQTTSNLVDVLLEDTKSLMMTPCTSLTEGLPLLVRQLCKQLGKEATLSVVGDEIEMDKRILGLLRDPLIHILRNSIDHGLETPSQRTASGKPVRGSLSLQITPVDRMVEFRIVDDGGGIDTERVKENAIKQGIIATDEASGMSAELVTRLIFKSSLSTSRIITEISGRGLGLAIVLERIEQLGGNVTVESEFGTGTTFIIRVPITIATFRGVLVQAGSRVFILPTASTDGFIEVSPREIVPIEDRDTLMLDNTIIPVSSLENLLDLPISSAYKKSGDDRVIVGILRAGSERAGFIVEDVLGEQEVLVKALGPVFSGVTAVSGVTILGSGQIAPILNVFDLFKMQRNTGAKALSRTASISPAASGGEVKRKAELRKRVLVVDDMVTARMLVRNIFELAGYLVGTASDGMEAFELLHSEQFDCVVSDLEMPRMDGIALTQAIRGDAKLRDLPVILITNMASREDRERGVSAGANAYFIKSNFDQANLLDVVSTLIG